jgi:hypothetical protein
VKTELINEVVRPPDLGSRMAQSFEDLLQSDDEDIGSMIDWILFLI